MDFKQLYLSIDGRINRSTFWLKFVLPVVIVSIVINIIAGVMMGSDPNNPNMAGFAILGIWQLILIYPSICVYGKRWHDRDKSAWWILIGLIPLVGPIWVLVECGFLKGTEGPNRFGEDPLAGA
ncbi:DUF805 domain-containing protein [Ruficoccus amylovorans]|uniref:DUF805 domain-containing protein n=1 Tax=Ruficoccus amylovorans TaxID=1804625 RepID=A0A842HDP6_9BACT|nr:DUF805 domain-containing protein [Ruficoccus amylovorans]MBC2594340.1 DUF805 domain-containing protein [Ruficoccus amylovorans]